MNRDDLMDDFITIMANCDTPEQGKRVLEDYMAGKTSISRRRAAEIVRKKMDEDTAKEIAGGDMMMASVVPDATVDIFMSYSLLRFQCGMQKDDFKEMLEDIAKEISRKYFG